MGSGIGGVVEGGGGGGLRCCVLFTIRVLVWALRFVYFYKNMGDFPISVIIHQQKHKLIPAKIQNGK